MHKASPTYFNSTLQASQVVSQGLGNRARIILFESFVSRYFLTFLALNKCAVEGVPFGNVNPCVYSWNRVYRSHFASWNALKSSTGITVEKLSKTGCKS